MRFACLSVFAAIMIVTDAMKESTEMLLRREMPAPHDEREKIEREARWAERLETHEGAESAHEHTSNQSLAPSLIELVVFLDVGSSSTKLHVYQKQSGNPPFTELAVPSSGMKRMKADLPLTAITDPAKKAQTKTEHEELFATAKNMLNLISAFATCDQQCRVVAYSTAGMRQQRNVIGAKHFDKLKTMATAAGFKVGDARVIGGNEEAWFSWYAVNSALGKTASNSVATIDVGGSSSQIAISPADGQIYEDYQEIKLGNDPVHVAVCYW